MNNYVMALFASGTTNFDYMGLGPLSDAISAIATETATSNGNITYTMEMDYPINGRLAGQLVEGNLIKAQVSKTPGDYMIFEINETLKSDDRTITVYCDAYANRILRMSFDNGGKFGSFGNVQQALNAARAQMTGIQSDFTLISGIGTSLNMSGVTSKNTLPTTYQDFNAYLDAIMDKVQGNVRFGINSIQIVSDRGRDITDTVLRDDKNTNGISIKVDTSNIVNRIIPMLPVKDKDGNITQETKVGKIVTSSVAFKFINFYAGQVVSVDNQDLANSYFNRTNCDRPTTTATVQTSMLDEDLTDIRLFDRVQVYSSKIGYQAKLRVCERDFDILAGAVSEFKLGSSSVTVFNSQTSVINAVNSAVQSSQYAAITADGKNTAYYEGTNPNDPKENDLWFHSVDGINQIDQYVNGNWVTIVSDSTGEQIRQKVEQARAEAHSAVAKAESTSEKVTQLASKYDDTNSLANQAMGKAVSAEGEASSAVATANSTASEFGKVDQKADSAVASALNAQNAASDAVKQASSAAADSKDAKQIAGAVSQSYKTLTDGSTMTIAELQNGLGAKLTKSALDGYATQTWTQNQVKITADGINGTMSSIKSTVDSQTTSINDLKADSNSFKSQFTTVNNTLGKQTTDISTLQSSSQELTSGFNTLTSDNTTNKNDISQLKQSATEVSSTLETVQTQVQNSAVGTNLLIGTAKIEFPLPGNNGGTQTIEKYDDATNYIQHNSDTPIDAMGPWWSWAPDVGQMYTLSADVCGNGYIEGDHFHYEGGDNGNIGRVDLTDDWKRISNTFRVNTVGGWVNWVIYANNSTLLKIKHIKIEKGSLSTDWCPNPADNATVTALSSLSQTVDRIKIDISKKIEQKDLNGYATETWTQNKIKTTADGITGTLSSVKTTVDRHDTSINELKADSSSFKTQFTTVTGTLDKQSTDISTLQASSKSLSASFDSLNSDNQTNQHNISQLQASAETFNSTLLTVQTQVQDSAVGTNLIINSNFSSGINHWNINAGNNSDCQVTVITDSDGDACLHITGTWGSCGVWCPPVSFNQNQVTTASVLAKGTGAISLIGLEGRPYSNFGTISTESYSKVGSTMQASASTNNFVIYFGPVQGVVDIYIKFVKLEVGSRATDYSTSPLDTATVTAVSSISQTIDSIQTTVRGKVDNNTYQSKMTQLDNQMTSVVGQVNNLGQRNLIYNSELRDNTDGWESNVPLYVGYNQRDHFNGSNSLVFSPHGFAIGDWSHAYSKMIPVVQGMQYSASATMFITGTTPPTATFISMEITFFNDNGDRVGLNGPQFDTSKWGDHQFLKVEGVVAPTGATKVCLAIQMNGEGNVVLNHPMMVSDATVGAYLPDTVGQSEFSQMATNINFKVSKDGVINAINISNDGTQIYGNKLHITADTYIDNAVIKDAMIASLNASKLHAGRIDASQIDVYNIDGSKINAYSITADKIQAGAMLIAMNSTLQTLKIGTDGLYTTNSSGTFIGKIHANNLIEHPNDWGLHFDLGAGAQYMAWGAQDSNDPNGGYVVKFGWTRNGSAGDFTMPWGGFWFNDSVMLHKNLSFDGGGIDVKDAYQLMKFAWIEMNGTKYPFFGSSNLKAGWMFGSYETYLVRDGGIINASKILGILNGQHYKFIKDLNSNGTVKGYVDVNF